MTIASRKYRLIEHITALEDEALLDQLEVLLLGEGSAMLLKEASLPVPERIETTLTEEINTFAPPSAREYDEWVRVANFSGSENVEDLIRDI